MPQFIGISMPAAYAGEITRGSFDFTTEAKANDTTTPVVAFGVPVKFNSAKTAVTPVTAASDAVIGFSVRKYGQADLSGAQKNVLVTVLKRGYIAVESAGTPVAGGQVYLTSAGKITASSSSTTALTGAVFCGSAVDGVVEIAYNI